MKKLVAMFLVIGMVLALLPMMSFADEEQIVITWMDDRTGEDGQYLRDEFVIKPFLEKHPNVKIDWQPTQDITKQVKIALGAGQGPDLMSIDGPSDALELYESGRTVALNDAVKKYGWDKVIYDWALDVAINKDGIITGVPAQYEGMLFYGNKEIMDAHNWKMPTTYEELKQLATEIREAGYVAPMILGTSTIPRRNEWWYSTLFGNYAGREATKDLLEGRKTFFDPEISGVFTTYKEMFDLGINGNQDTFAVTLADGRAMYYSGMTVLVMEGDWFVDNGIQNGVDQYVALPPSFREGVPQSYALSVGGCYVVNKAVENDPVKLELIYELLDILYSRPDLYVASLEAGGQVNCISVDQELIDNANLLEPVKEKLKITDEAMDKGNVGHCTWTFFPQDVRVYMYEKADAYLIGDLSLEDYLQAMQDMLDVDIKEGKVPPVM